MQTRISKVPMPSTKSLLVDSFLPRDSFSKEAEGSSINEDRQLQDTVLMGNQITDLEIMKEREEAIHRICKSCLDVLEILQHMKSVTERQDEKLDLIDTNMETAQSYIAKSTQRIQKVQEGQRSALWRNVVILALVSMILLLTIKIMFR